VLVVPGFAFGSCDSIGRHFVRRLPSIFSFVWQFVANPGALGVLVRQRSSSSGQEVVYTIEACVPSPEKGRMTSHVASQAAYITVQQHHSQRISCLSLASVYNGTVYANLKLITEESEGPAYALLGQGFPRAVT